ncbi:cupin domain-containing protein [Desulfovibrio sp. OttesenSCG-928-M14]|nr:cupin domain-containing protein [Desulfovibrio sp. OttesenSCG-928-M14]
MIRRHAELKVDVHNEFRGGKGSVTLEHFMDQQMANGAGRLFAHSILAPGSSVGLHKHEGDCEVYYILEGKALVNDNGTETELGPGDINFCPDGGSHAIANIGDTDLRYIAIILFTKQKELV